MAYAITTDNMRRAKHRVIQMAVPRADPETFLNLYSLRNSGYAGEEEKGGYNRGKALLVKVSENASFAIHTLP